MAKAPGEIIHRTKRGVIVRYSPSQGSSVRYRVVCPHGNGVNDRTLADARQDARDVDTWCDECAADNQRYQDACAELGCQHG